MKAPRSLTRKRAPHSTDGPQSPDKPVARASSAAGDERRRVSLLARFRADPILGSIVDAFEVGAASTTDAKNSGRKFGSNGLKVNGKLFALFTQGTLVVKLPKERVAALVAARVGSPFDPGHGRLMKEWLTVTDTKAIWFDLAKEAHDFVKASIR